MGLSYSQFIGASGNASCIIESDIYKDKYFLPIGGILSTICYIYLFYLYFMVKAPALKRHPTTLAIYKCMFEMLFVQAYIWTPFVPNSYWYINDSGGACVSTPLAAVFSFWSQFFLLGGEIWFAVVAIDLQLCYSNPFSSFALYKKYYLSLIFGVSLLYSILLVCFGPDAYGVSSLGVLWVQDRKGQENFIKIVCFYSLMPVIYFIALFTILSLSLKMRKGFTDTLKIRLSIMKRSRSYLIGYSLFWGVVFALELASALIYRYSHDNTNTLSDNLASAAAYCFAFRGVWAVVMIIYPNWDDLHFSLQSTNRLGEANNKEIVESVRENLVMKPHLNSALRAEILFFTTEGIKFAAEISESAHHSNSSNNNSNNSSSHNSTNNVNSSNIRRSKSPARLSIGVAHVLDDDDCAANRDSQFSFKDILERNSFQSELPHRDSDVIPKDSIGSSGVSSAIRVKVMQQNNVLHQTVLQEVEKNLKYYSDTGLYSAHAQRDTIDASTERCSGALDTPSSVSEDDIEMNRVTNTSMYSAADLESVQSSIPSNANRSSKEATTTVGHSSGKEGRGGAAGSRGAVRGDRGGGEYGYWDEDYISSPFYDFDEMEREMRMSNKSDSQRSDKSSASTSSQQTVKWRDTTDLHLRMVSTVNPQYNQQQLQQKQVWEQQQRQLQSSNNGNANRNSRKSSSSIHKRSNSTVITDNESLVKSFFQLFEQAKAAASSVVYGAYDEFGFVDYSTKQFAHLRNLCGIDVTSYRQAFNSTTNESFSEGRSGAFMFYSSDLRYIVKTTTKSELDKLLSILPEYIAYLNGNPNSLLTRYLGAHCITMYSTKLYFIVMLNVFPNEKLSEKYDLKGSWVNRFGNRGDKRTRRERLRSGVNNSAAVPVYQDNDVQHKIFLKPDVAVELLHQVRQDTKFLLGLNIMDYSLLVGVVRRNFEVVSDAAPLYSELGDANRYPQQPEQQIGKSVDNIRNSSSSVNRLDRLERSESAVLNRLWQSIDGSSIYSSSPSLAQSDFSGSGISFELFLREGMNVDVVDGPGTYYIGLIDMLQEWNWTKQMERWYKVYVLGQPRMGISAIEPEAYQKRFIDRTLIEVFEGLSIENNSPSTSNIRSKEGVISDNSKL